MNQFLSEVRETRCLNVTWGEGAASMIFCPQNCFSTGTDSMEGIRIQARLLRQVQALILNSVTSGKSFNLCFLSSQNGS